MPRGAGLRYGDAMTSLPERSLLVKQHLDEAGIRADIVVLPESARTAADAAAAIGCEISAIANSLVFLADGNPVLVMTSGGHRADLGTLARSIGADEVSMAPAAVVREWTGQAIGGVAPVGHPAPLPTYIDETLRSHDRIWAAAGHPHTAMPLTFDSLQALTRGIVIPVA